MVCSDDTGCHLDELAWEDAYSWECELEMNEDVEEV